MNDTMAFLRIVRPATWPETYEKTKKLSTALSGLGWPLRSQVLSEELGRLIQLFFAPRPVEDWMESGRDKDALKVAEDAALSAKILVTAVLLDTDCGETGHIGIPFTVEHALTLSLTLVAGWGNAAQKLLELRDDECDGVLASLPGYMLTMLADDLGTPSTRRDRVRAIWTPELLGTLRGAPSSLAIH
jgi:hypothetical protein